MGEYHARLSASGSKRWMTCPGSVAYIEKLKIIDVPSKYAAEGTVAHEVHEKCLKSKGVLNPKDFMRKKMKADGFEFVVNQDMVDAVSMSVNYVRDRIEELELEYGGHVELIVEKFVYLTELNIPGLEGGTSDVILVAYDQNGKVCLVEIVDYKHGAGVPVEAVDNTQMMIYAVATLIELGLFEKEIQDGIRMTISQPRAHHPEGRIRSHTISAKRLAMWVHEELKPAAVRASESEGNLEDLVASEDGCRFCNAAGECPRLLEKTQEVAMLDFADVEPQLPDVARMTPEQKAQVVKHIDMLRSFIVAVEKSVTEEMNAGSTEYGEHFKLVRKTTRRKFIDDIDDEDFSPLLDYLPEENVFTKKLRSMSDIERDLKKLLGKQNAEVVMQELTTKPEGEVVVALVTDRRKAVEPEITGDFAELADKE